MISFATISPQQVAIFRSTVFNQADEAKRLTTRRDIHRWAAAILQNRRTWELAEAFADETSREYLTVLIELLTEGEP